ncbi:CPCC family cysteine-rich protein [Sinorhizobium fredii]|uniref:Cysteine-rich CPCC domain-containing protein n=2 Tax=Rhizobium fredii TaxID=380 RepID=A0A844ABQ3_RHIFR|nr:hypothetical protein [Sinorhizobium fredii]MQW96750.1 hypothetical protein [Sinorhizobium fredii]MQX10403.1 hypothetical protein [Sinorhizobium fredii]UTY50846.1 hypothetical protein EPK84_30855 [Sinorhizobium fredii]GEC31845.1 hypothetical protein EFR01_20160 [Sinorhizobium fredii]
MTGKGVQYFNLAASAASRRVEKDGYFACPCCDSYSLTEAGEWEICNVCGWEDDPAQEAVSDLAGGANKVSLLLARENYRLSGCSDPQKLNQRPKLP